MTIIREVSVKELKEKLYDIDLTDPKLYEEANSDSIGIFQLNANTAAGVLKKIEPQNFDELNAINAFARPGTIDFVDEYVSNRDSNTSKYPDVVAELLDDTHSIILYQEQVMKIFNIIGGFSLEETNDVRAQMKRLSRVDKTDEDLAKWDKTIKRFTAQAKEKGLTTAQAKELADDLLKMSSYQFNLSHSTAYTYIAAQNLYLSLYFRKYFYAAVLSYEFDKGSDLIGKISSAKKRGFDILRPEINHSMARMSTSGDNGVLFGLTEIKKVGEKAVDFIIEERKNGEFKNFFDFLIRTRNRAVTSAVIKALLAVGAFSEIEVEKDVNKLIRVFEAFWVAKKAIKLREKLEIIWDKCFVNDGLLPSPETTLEDLINYEKEYLGHNFFTSPFSDELVEKFNMLEKKGLLKLKFEALRAGSVKVPVIVNSIRDFNDKNGNAMAFVEIEDLTGSTASIPMFSSVWKYLRDDFSTGVYLINLYLKDGKPMFGKSNAWNVGEDEVLRWVKQIKLED